MDRYDIIGDVHGCFTELKWLMADLGYGFYDGDPRMPKFPENRKLVFLGDMIDRGPHSDLVLDIVMQFVEIGKAVAILGNHDIKLLRYLREDVRGGHSKVQVGHGLRRTIEQLDARGMEYKKKVLTFLESLSTIYETDDLILVHGAYVQGSVDKEARDFHLYGVVDRSAGKDSNGFPKRSLNWREKYTGRKTIAVGHIVVPEVDKFVTASEASIYMLDTGACFGGKLTALRFPEHQIIQVQAREDYWKSKTKLGSK